MKLITQENYLKGRDKKYPIDSDQERNMNVIIQKANALLDRFGEYRACTSGYRPAELNSAVVGASKTSKHIRCLAIDLEDIDGRLKKFILDNVQILEELGLWMEDPEKTKTWVHIQSIPFNSWKEGKTRIFKT